MSELNEAQLLSGQLSFREPHSYEWQPQPDITTYELARCMPMFYFAFPGHYEATYQSLPPECQRHFIEHRPAARR